MTPTVYFSGSLNTSNIEGLLIAIQETTGLRCGFRPWDMVDTQFISVIITFKAKRISKPNVNLVDTAIRAWSIGYGLGNPRISWA
jgi:hypothetical protein